MKSVSSSILAVAALVLSLHAAADPQAFWERRAERVIAHANADASQAQRAVALMRGAIERSRSAGSNGGNGASAQDNTDPRRAAATAVAAFAVLEALFPEQLAELEVALAVALADVPESQAKADGLVLGRRIAAEMLSRP